MRSCTSATSALGSVIIIVQDLSVSPLSLSRHSSSPHLTPATVGAVFICAKQQKDPNRIPHDWGLSPGHLVPSRGWGGGVDEARKTYAIRFA